MVDEKFDRRNFLAASGLAGAAVLAGCTGAEQQENEGEEEERLAPPSSPGLPDDEYWAFVIESLNYQNQVLSELREE